MDQTLLSQLQHMTSTSHTVSHMKNRCSWLCIHGYDSVDRSYMGKKNRKAHHYVLQFVVWFCCTLKPSHSHSTTFIVIFVSSDTESGLQFSVSIMTRLGWKTKELCFKFQQGQGMFFSSKASRPVLQPTQPLFNK
jgi:hypothetical protein